MAQLQLPLPIRALRFELRFTGTEFNFPELNFPGGRPLNELIASGLHSGQRSAAPIQAGKDTHYELTFPGRER